MTLLILAGTEDGRMLAEKFQEKGHQVIVSTLTEYGEEIAKKAGLKARSGAFNEESLGGILAEKKIKALIDATHPYAQNIRQLARKVAQDTGIPYFRWERPSGDYPDDPLVHFAKDLEEAGRLAGKLGKRVFLSTGSRSLPQFLDNLDLKECELFARVLPTANVIRQCEDLGLKPYQIVAMQGPFSEKLNEALWEQLKIDVVISKESGTVGGTKEKVQACLNLGIPIIIWQRPQSELLDGCGKAKGLNEKVSPEKSSNQAKQINNKVKNDEIVPGVKVSGEQKKTLHKDLHEALGKFVREVEKNLEH